MKRSLNKAIAAFTLMIMIITIMVPLGVNADDTSTPSASGDDGSVVAEKLVRDKIRVLEIYPNELNKKSEKVNDMDVRKKLGTDSRFEVTTMSINRLISLQQDINGNYDIVYFNGGNYTRNATTEHSYGSDITYLTADKLDEFIESGQLCVFHTDVFTNKSGDMYATILKERFSKYRNNAAYANVRVVSNKNKNSTIDSFAELYKDNSEGMNQRPILVITDSPLAYTSANQAAANNKLTFSFKVYDPETPLDEFLMVSLYIDRNNDSLYSEKEIIYPQVDGATGQQYTVKVKNGHAGTITYNMPQGLTGVYFWKLVVSDARDAKNEASNVFKLKGSKIEVRVLQVKPDDNGNLSLINQFKKDAEDYGHKYGLRQNEYEIKVTEITVKNFNKNIGNGTLKLNGNYDMVILGFDDNYTDKQLMDNQYGGALGQDAINALDSFIKTQQSVMFTHDTIHFRHNKLLTEYFADDVGQVLNADGPNRKNGNNFVGIWTAGLAGVSSDNSWNGTDHWNRSDAVDKIKIFDPNKDYQTINTSPGNNGEYVNPVNTSALTLYPFVIEGGKYDNHTNRKVAATHYQWFKLDLEDAEVIPLFNLFKNGEDKFNDDAMNNYYTYTRKNITYSGTGHSNGYTDFETKLFVNTAIKAYSIANHAPEITVFEPQDNDKISKAAESMNLRFRAYDFDLGDDVLKYSVDVDKNNNGHYVSLCESVNMDNGQVVNIDVDKAYMPDEGIFKVRITAKDMHDASSEKVLTLERVDVPMITPTIQICDASGTAVSGVLYNEVVNAKMTFTVSGKSTPQKIMNPVFDLTGIYLNEDVDTYLDDSSLGAVTFYPASDPVPNLITKDYNGITIAPESTSETNLQLNVKVEEIPGFMASKTATDSVNIRTGQVKVTVLDQDNNPVKNVTVKDLGGTDTWTTGTDGSVLIEKVAGTKDFDIVVPSGYQPGSETIHKLNPAGNVVSTESEVNLTYDDYNWEIIYKINFTGVNAIYYKINQGRTSVTPIGLAGVAYELKNHTNMPASILVKISVDPLASGKLTKMEYIVETWNEDGTVQLTSGPNMAVVDSTADNITAISGFGALDTSKQLLSTIRSAPAGGNLAGQEYYMILDVPRTNTQKIMIKKVLLTIQPDAPSALPIEKTIDIDSQGIKFNETTPPLLR